MSHCYVGPFGRLLPLPDRTPTPVASPISQQTEWPSSKAARFEASASVSGGLRPAKQVGSPDLQLRNTMGDLGRPQYMEQLPSVSQLLTPASQASVPASPFAQHRTLSTPVLRPSYSLPTHPTGHPLQPQLYHGHGLPPISSYYAAGAGVQYQPSRSSSGPLSPSSFEENSARHPASALQADRGTLHYHQGHLPTHQNGPLAYSGANNNVPPHLSRTQSVPHRVARVVDERIIPGEGVCYIYEDGSHCRKSIDGEGVNPEWGVTKAGKPRKRLAQACITCREKKIKCDPSYPKCVQCHKFSRECRFENA